MTADHCTHRRCGNPEFHFSGPDGGYGPACEPFTLSPNECECRVPACYGTLPDPGCKTCGGTGYVR